MAQSYVRNWVTQHLLLEKAEVNLSAEQLDVSDKLEEYRQSLLIYQYQREYIRQQMDTTVTDTELAEYYEANKDNFKLKDNIARMLFVRLPNNSKDVKKVMKLCQSDKEEDREELNAFCQQHAIKFMLMDEKWNIFNDVMLEIPEGLAGQPNALFRTGTVEVSDSTGHYILSIKEIKARNEVAPLEFEAASIKGIILNKRKIDLVKSLEQQIFDEGLSKNHVQIN
jgi:protein subunit release factor A